MSDYGSTIKGLREKAGMTQRELAEKLCVTAQAISKWENGVNQPDLGTIEKICEIFSCTLDEFIHADGGKVAPLRKKRLPLYLTAGGLGAVILALVILACVLFSSPVLSAEEIYRRVDPAVFSIVVETETGKQGGTGFFIDGNGAAVTNFHVIEGGVSAQIRMQNGKTCDISEVLGASRSRDLAILKVDAEHTPAVKLASRLPAVGEKVYAIGYPESFLLGDASSTFTDGIVSKSNYTVDGMDYIQTNADITHGNSGGVLVNERGEVVGITAGTLDVGVTYMNLAIPAGEISSVERGDGVKFEQFKDTYKPLTVTYRDSATGDILARRDVFTGECAPELSLDRGSGYGKFEGWFSDMVCTSPFDFSRPITSDTELWGKWIPIEYTVRFDAGEGSGQMASVTVRYGEKQAPPACTFTPPAGKSFKEWQMNGVRVDDLSTLSQKEGDTVTLTAFYTDLTYNVRFVSDVAARNLPGEMKNISYSRSVYLPRLTTDEKGKVFEGWTLGGVSYSAEREYSKLSNTGEDVVFHAVWRQSRYTVVYLDSESGTSYSEQHDYGERFTLRSEGFSRTGYTLVRWEMYVGSDRRTYAAGERAESLTDEDGATVKLYAQFAPISYTVLFEANNGTGTTFSFELNYDTSFGIDEIPYSSGISYPLHALERWRVYRDSAHTQEIQPVTENGEQVFLNLSAQDGATVYAVAEWRWKRYTVIYEYQNEALFSEETDCSHDYTFRGEELLASAPRDDGYNFSGWTSVIFSSDRNTFAFGATSAPLPTLTTQEGDDGRKFTFTPWLTPHTYTLLFDGGEGATGETPSMQYQYRDWTVLLPECTFEREGNTFLAWEYGGKSYLPGRMVTDTGVVSSQDGDAFTFTAKWEKSLTGHGTAEEPYLVSSFEEFQAMQNLVYEDYDYASAFYALTADIDCADGAIGTLGYHGGTFYGSLDGRGHVIKNMILSVHEETRVAYAGFISVLSDKSSIKNFGLENYTLTVDTGKDDVYVGAVAGVAYGTLENVYARGTLTVKGAERRGTLKVGGLCGSFFGSAINCYALGTIDATYGTADGLSTNEFHVGGLFGYATLNADSDVVERCYSNTDIKATAPDSAFVDTCVGGFVGHGTGEFKNCLVLGNVSLRYGSRASFELGLFRGKKEGVTLTNCYAAEDCKATANNVDYTVGEFMDVSLETFPRDTLAETLAQMGFGDEWQISDGVPFLKQFMEA